MNQPTSRHDGFVDPAIALRLEAQEARAATDLVALRVQTVPDSGAETLVVAGATCAWFAPESVLSHVFSLGLRAETTDADLAAIEAFYRAKGDRRVQVELSPHARKSTFLRLGERGYVISGFEQVLARRLHPGDRPTPGAARASARTAAPAIDVRAIDPSSVVECAQWVRVAGEGFFSPDGVPRELEGVIELTPRMSGAVAFLATVDGQPAAAGAVAVDDGIASMFGAATLPAFRRSGAHAALLAARLAHALAAGAEWATAGALPGSGSQHNMERHGLRVAYTRPVMVRALRDA